jgi:hypothetical protein
MARRSTTTIAILTADHKRLVEYCDGQRSVGRSITDVASLALRWFVRQDDAVKTAVLSDVDKGMEPLYAKALRSLADDLEHPAPRRSARVSRANDVSFSESP